MTSTFDQSCYDLARLFLSDENCTTHDHVVDLATQIQQTIESYLDTHSGLTEDTADGR